MPRRFLFRLMAPIVGLSFLLLASGGIGAWYVQHVYHDAAETVVEHLPIARTAQRLEHMLYETRERLFQCAMYGQEEDFLAMLELVRQTQLLLHSVESDSLTDSGRRLLQELIHDHRRFSAQLNQVVRRFQNRYTSTALREAARRLMDAPFALGTLDNAIRYRELSVRQLEDAIQQSRRQAERAGTLLWLLGLLGATAGLVGGYGASRVLQESLVELSLPVRDAAGRLSEVVGPIRITASTNLDQLRSSLGQLSERVAAAVNKLQETQREHLRAEQLAALGQLAAGLAHELRNPLTAMKTLVQAARQPGGRVSLNHRDLDVLEEEMTRLGRTLQTFLDYARPPQPHRQWTGISDVVQSTLVLVAPRAAQQGITIETEIPAELPPAHLDAEQIRQTLLNLLLNAFDAMPEGGQVVISAEVEAGGPDPESLTGHWIRLKIRDNGIGLPEGLGEKMFEPFTSTKEAGTGLGLAISRQIAESHGGSIHAEPVEPHGAIFTLRLPQHPPQDESEEAVAPPGSFS